MATLKTALSCIVFFWTMTAAASEMPESAQSVASPLPLPLTVCFSSQDVQNARCESGTGSSWKFTAGSAAQGTSVLWLEMPPMADVSAGVLDASGRLLASKVRTETGAALTRISFLLDVPLAPGTRYSIRIDGFSDDWPTGVSGEKYATVRVDFRTQGEAAMVPASPKDGKAAIRGKNGGKSRASDKGKSPKSKAKNKKKKKK